MYFISYNPEKKIIENRVKGDISLDATEAIIAEVLALVIKHDCRKVLSDYTEGNLKLSTFELYDFPETTKDRSDAQDISVFSIKRAIVVSHDLEEFSFFELVNRNRGQQVKVFRNRAEAENWLLG